MRQISARPGDQTRGYPDSCLNQPNSEGEQNAHSGLPVFHQLYVAANQCSDRNAARMMTINQDFNTKN